jgi:hypothetical protein
MLLAEIRITVIYPSQSSSYISRDRESTTHKASVTITPTYSRPGGALAVGAEGNLSAAATNMERMGGGDG